MAALELDMGTWGDFPSPLSARSPRLHGGCGAMTDMKKSQGRQQTDHGQEATAVGLPRRNCANGGFLMSSPGDLPFPHHPRWSLPGPSPL